MNMVIIMNILAACLETLVDRSVAEHFCVICCNVVLVLPLQPQTLYDKINFQRHPAVGASASSPYQEVL